MSMNCDKCVHKNVCKNEEAARNFEKKLKEFKLEADMPVCIKIAIYCDNFSSRYGKKEDGPVLRTSEV